VNAALDNGISTLTLTNIYSTYDAWNFVKFCKEKGIKPIVGTENP